MIQSFSVTDKMLRRLDCSRNAYGLTDATWIDLLDPTPEQESSVEAVTGVRVPTQAEIRAIDASSQIYYEGASLVMIARVINRSQEQSLRLISVTFILFRNRLITLRFCDPMPFRNFVARAEKEVARLSSGEEVMVGLLAAIVDRAAEILQAVGDELEALSTDIFNQDPSLPATRNQRDLRPAVQKLGRNGYLASRVRESLHSLARIVPYLQSDKVEPAEEELPVRLEKVARDIASLLDHDSYLMSNVTFLLDATLGLINIQQNGIIKIFSVAAVIFLPPTLIASIYGMNFEHMPELKWMFGYPYAVILMVSSAIVPYLFFKRRGWL